MRHADRLNVGAWFAMVGIGLAGACAVARADEPSSEEKQSVRLFNGRDFTGWTFSSEEQRAAWSVTDGVLSTAGRPNGYIRTVGTYENYVLELDLRHHQSGNSGVLIRLKGEDKVWPHSLEVQGHHKSLGDIWLMDGFRATAPSERINRERNIRRFPDVVQTHPVGEWNHLRIVVDGEKLSIYVNGELANEATGLETYAGAIGLQTEGAPLDFRNIELTLITNDNAASASTHADP